MDKNSNIKALDMLYGSLPERSVWDDYVKIIEDPSEMKFTVFLSKEIVEPSEYDRLCYMLENVEEDYIVELAMTTPGGRLDTTFKIVDSMNKCKAKIVGILSGSVASAGTVLTMFCDELKVGDNLEFMIHASSGGYGGKLNEVHAYHEFQKEESPKIFNYVYKGFLTDEEIQEVVKGRDIWLNSAEVLERWKIKKS
jgi:ATP-dependent protease ClpP protease subunit